MAVHTKRARRPKNVSGRSSSSSATSKREVRGEHPKPSETQYPAAREQLKYAQTLKNQLEERKVDLIKVDLDTAFTFARIAQDAADDEEKRLRNREHARRGHDAVVHFFQTAGLDPSEREAIYRRIGQLKSLLEDLGESFA